MPPDDAEWVVLINHEQQYSLWPALNGVPAGWTAVTQPASRDASLAYVETAWTDMRPLSVRGSVVSAA